jgi:hypothetical protein
VAKVIANDDETSESGEETAAILVLDLSPIRDGRRFAGCLADGLWPIDLEYLRRISMHIPNLTAGQPMGLAVPLLVEIC